MKWIWIPALVFATASCNNEKQEKAPSPEVKSMPVVGKDTAMMKLAFDSKKDLVCGMPVSAGITDTVQYKGKLYGFCSKECRDEFVKTPDQFIKEGAK